MIIWTSEDIPTHKEKAYRRSGGRVPIIPKLGRRLKLSSGRTRVSMQQRVGWAKEQVCTIWGKETPIVPPVIWAPDLIARSPVTLHSATGWNILTGIGHFFLIGLNVDALKLYKKYHKTPCGTSLQGWMRTGSSWHHSLGPRKCSKTMNAFRVYTERRGCIESNYPGGQSWVKVNTAGTLRYSVTSVLHNEVK
jgi:hypothetical protein